jgi:ribosomal protein S18 acetylase RimI-like enzyme
LFAGYSGPMSTEPTKYLIRSITADEWPEVKQLRLLALQDPVAHLAFLDTYENALAKPDSYWKERAAWAARDSPTAQQIIAQSSDGTWVASVTVLIEEAGTVDWAGYPIERRQGHVVGVWVRPDHRGIGMTERMFDHALEWAWHVRLDRVRLMVNAENARAQGLYRKYGFVPTGRVIVLEATPGASELEFAVERGI